MNWNEIERGPEDEARVSIPIRGMCTAKQSRACAPDFLFLDLRSSVVSSLFRAASESDLCL